MLNPTDLGERPAERVESATLSSFRERERQKGLKHYRWRMEFLSKYKAQRGCEICSTTDPIVLDFDHVRGKKEFNIAMATARGIAWKRILREIKKCRVLCANCHRRETYRRRHDQTNRVPNQIP